MLFFFPDTKKFYICRHKTELLRLVEKLGTLTVQMLRFLPLEPPRGSPQRCLLTLRISKYNFPKVGRGFGG